VVDAEVDGAPYDGEGLSPVPGWSEDTGPGQLHRAEAEAPHRTGTEWKSSSIDSHSQEPTAAHTPQSVDFVDSPASPVNADEFADGAVVLQVGVGLPDVRQRLDARLAEFDPPLGECARRWAPTTIGRTGTAAVRGPVAVPVA
jgi:hypothetical protein